VTRFIGFVAGRFCAQASSSSRCVAAGWEPQCSCCRYVGYVCPSANCDRERIFWALSTQSSEVLLVSASSLPLPKNGLSRFVTCPAASGVHSSAGGHSAIYAVCDNLFGLLRVLELIVCPSAGQRRLVVWLTASPCVSMWSVARSSNAHSPQQMMVVASSTDPQHHFIPGENSGVSASAYGCRCSTMAGAASDDPSDSHGGGSRLSRVQRHPPQCTDPFPPVGGFLAVRRTDHHQQ